MCGGSVGPVSELPWRDDSDREPPNGHLLVDVLLATLALEDAPRPALVGFTGSVCVGKSTTVALVAARLRALGCPVTSISGDAFLWPNARLDAAGLSMQKGFPETYDSQTLRDTLAELHRGRAVDAPVYRHDTYDIVPGEWDRIEPAEVVLVDGLHLGRFARTEIDRLVYLHAADDVLERWYIDRFERLVEAAGRSVAGGGPATFYAGFLPMAPDDRRELASVLWRSINLTNLHDHISADRELADVVITFDEDHDVVSVETRPAAP
jgi:type I pantothenate kinase